VRTPKTVVTVALASLAMLFSVVAEPAVAQRGSTQRHDRFHSAHVYRGSFPDPDVFRLGTLWVAASTTIAHRSLPMLTSHDGRTWRARRAQGAGHRRTNDAMVGVPRWAHRKRAGSRRFVPIWAPAIGRIRHGRWVAAYAAPLRRHPGKRCVGIATAKRALGPFRNLRKRPLVCPKHQGAIDPDIFRDRGHTYLLWKTEGIWGHVPTSLWIRELRHNGRGFRPGSRTHRLLTTGPAWERPVIENPSMIRYRGRLYLFYSGNRWYSRHYAIGYAVCRSVHGPCRRVQRHPLLATGGRVAGPGGESAFRGPHGQLMLAYAAWPAGRVGHERRLHVATLKARRHGRLVVVRRSRHR
jgi:beta-xylosidase